LTRKVWRGKFGANSLARIVWRGKFGAESLARIVPDIFLKVSLVSYIPLLRLSIDPKFKLGFDVDLHGLDGREILWQCMQV